MKTLNDNIKKGEYQKVYLIYGEEEYLKKQYKDRMKQAIIGDDTINYSYFEGDNTKPEDVITICETIPFFSERRLVIVSDSGYFKTANDKMADYIKELPDYLILIFIEKDVDKRNKVYKAVSSNGYVCEMQYQTPATLKRWIAGMMASNDYKISEAACELLLDKTGASMELIRNEIDKLISYCSDKKMVMPQDGSFNIVTGVYGYGGFLVYNNEKYIITGSGSDSEMASMRNVAGEILGSMAAVEKAIELGVKSVDIYFDYMGIRAWALGEWKRNKKGTIAYYDYMQSVKDKIAINFVKVKGHSGVEGNEEADRLAKKAVGIL